jgi:hypothetical protein
MPLRDPPRCIGLTKCRVAAWLVLVAVFWGSNAAAQGIVLQTSVAPLPEEDLARNCRYELTITNNSRPIRAVWVIFDRGRDMLRYYGDPEIQEFALRHDIALLMPFMCGSKQYEDMNVDPSKGIGRALFAGLSQLADASGHKELGSTKVILLGFSGAGSLVARLVAYAPDRVIAAISADPGHFDPLGIDTVTLSDAVLAVPQLVLSGGSDPVSGTQRPYEYFRRHFDRGAPWAFVIQNKTPHCCIINAKRLITQWLDEVVISASADTLRVIDRTKGWGGFIETRVNETKDSWGGMNSSVSEATIRPVRSKPPDSMSPAGWFPTEQLANSWLTFIRLSEHPIMSLP